MPDRLDCCDSRAQHSWIMDFMHMIEIPSRYDAVDNTDFN